MSRIVEVSGTVVEVAQGVLFTEKSGNITYRHPYLMIEGRDGETVRVSDVFTNQEVEPQIKVGTTGTYYFRKSRVFQTFLRRTNVLIATETESGIRTHVISTAGLGSLFFMTMLISPFLVYLGYISFGWLFWDSVSEDMGLLISAWPIWGFFLYLFLIARLKVDAIRLKRRLTRQSISGAQFRTAVRTI